MTNSIEDIVGAFDSNGILGLTKLSNEDRENLRLTYRLLENIGYVDNDQNQIVYEAWSDMLWKNTKFREKVLLGIEDRTLLRLCGMDDAPVLAGNSRSNQQRAKVLSGEPFAPRKSAWQRLLMHILGVSNASSQQSVQGTNNSPIRTLQVGERMHSLRDFQLEVVDEIRKRLNNPVPAKSVVFLPTGAGKTRVTIEAILEHAQSLASGLVVLWVAGEHELCRQAEGTLKSVFEDTGLRGNNIEHDYMSVVSYYNAGLSEELFQTEKENLEGVSFVVATPDQLDRRKEKGSWGWISDYVDVIVVDEAHGAIEEWGRITSDLSNSAHILALTATPDSLSFNDAFGDDWILPEKTLNTDTVDMLEALVKKKILAERIDLNKSVEDFAWREGKGNQLEDSTSNIDSPIWYECLRDLIIEEIRRSDDSVLVYVDRIKQARILSAMVNFHFSSKEDKRRCGAVWGAMTSRSRREMVAEFIRKGSDLRGLVNAKLLTQGFDAPRVGSVVIARATDPQTALYRQMVGRGLRGGDFGGTPECRVFRVS